jgi:hypothetical protein
VRAALIGGYELNRSRQARQRNGAAAGATEVPPNLAMPIDILVDVFQLDPCHGRAQTPVPAVRRGVILPRKRVKRQIERADVPHLSAIDLDRPRHPAVGIELPCRDPDVHRGLVTRESTARNGSDL